MPRTLPPKNAAERAALAAAKRAAKTPEQLEKEKAQHESHSYAPLAYATLKNYQTAMRWFGEFLQAVHPEIDTNFRAPGAPPPPLPLLKEYLRFVAESRVGRIRDEVSVITLERFGHSLLYGLRREAHHDRSVVRGFTQQLKGFIRSTLVEEELAHTDAFTKHVVDSQDLTFLCAKLWSPEYVTTFQNHRKFINLNLFILLLVDTCERGGALACNAQADPSGEKCLRWGDISFFTYMSADDSMPTFDIRAVVWIRWAKGMRLSEKNWKKVPLAELLPLDMFREDTLRLLLVLAIHDGVFEGVTKWEDLGRLRAPATESQTGARIKITADKSKLPVLRNTGWKGSERNVVTDLPALLNNIHLELSRLGRFASYEGRLVGYCFRRGVANQLRQKQSEENRKFAMGHKSLSEAYSIACAVAPESPSSSPAFKLEKCLSCDASGGR